MNKKILIASILAAAVIIMLPISNVVGTNVIRQNSGKGVINSPLFASRISSYQKEDTKKIQTSFLGKGIISNIFLLKRSSLNSWIDKAIKIVDARPDLLTNLLDQIENIPRISEILKENGISIVEFKDHIDRIKNDPSFFEKEIHEATEMIGTNIKMQINDPEPLGFSGQPGCLIAFLIVFPIILMIGTMIATFTIITCLNIRNCFETLMQNIFEGFSQGLYQPDY